MGTTISRSASTVMNKWKRRPTTLLDGCFLRDRFDEEARSVEASIMSIKPLKERYGNTLSSTLYRFVESVGQERAVLGVICGHPHERKRARDFDIQFPCRHVILSPAFRDRFGDVDEVDLFLKIASYCGAQGGGRWVSRKLY